MARKAEGKSTNKSGLLSPQVEGRLREVAEVAGDPPEKALETAVDLYIYLVDEARRQGVPSGEIPVAIRVAGRWQAFMTATFKWKEE